MNILEVAQKAVAVLSEASLLAGRLQGITSAEKEALSSHDKVELERLLKEAKDRREAAQEELEAALNAVLG